MVQQFQQVIGSAEELRAVVGTPHAMAVDKAITEIDEHCRAFIAQSPFVLLATSDASGRCDVSPKGDAPGFVQVLDAQTLAIPDRPGNRRADSFSNILANPARGAAVHGAGDRRDAAGWRAKLGSWPILSCWNRWRSTATRRSWHW